MKVLPLILLQLMVLKVEGSRILFYFPFSHKSIKMTYWPLVEEMAKRDHQVTVVMPFDQSLNPYNVTVINADPEKKLQKMLREASSEMLDVGNSGHSPIFPLLEIILELNDNALNHREMKRLIHGPDAGLDLVIMCPFLAGEASYYLAHRMNASLVLYSPSQTTMPMIERALGRSVNPAASPLFMLPLPVEMDFTQRLINFIGTAFFEHIFLKFIVHPRVDALLDKHFPEDIERPALPVLADRTSLAFVFSHPFILDGFEAKAPNYVNIGMMNCRPPRPLKNPRLSDFIKNSNANLIYISFGSALTASKMCDQKRKMFLNVIRSFPQYNFLWKWETEVMEDKPSNLMLAKWLPQQDILGHSKTKLFISHVGQSSFQESLCHQKPVLGIPVHADQFGNSLELERLGFGIRIPYQMTTEASLFNSIFRLLNESSFSENARKTGSLLMDQKEHPLDRAVWWLEHILRHPGAYVGKSPAKRLNWFQYNLIDIYAFLFAILCLFSAFVIKAMLLIFSNNNRDKIKID